MKENLLYDSVPAIAALNHVDGFEPRSMMREIGNDQNKTLYLDVLFRKLWFRLKNPNGRISKRIVKLTDQLAVVEARVYLDKDDGEENYLANAFGLRFYNTDGEFGMKYLEMAETAATGRALADAGYGSQFADAGDEYDPVQVDAGVSLPEPESAREPLKEESAAGITASAEAAPTAATSAVTPPRKPIYTMDMDVEQIKSMMTLEEAMNLTISAGSFKGRPLGQTAADKPSCLKWFMTGYKGPDNILRAAATLLYESAMKAAG